MLDGGGDAAQQAQAGHNEDDVKGGRSEACFLQNLPERAQQADT
ncbi:MAG: hypothetical protein WBO09_02685 [Methylocystis silviterrae]